MSLRRCAILLAACLMAACSREPRDLGARGPAPRAPAPAVIMPPDAEIAELELTPENSCFGFLMGECGLVVDADGPELGATPLGEAPWSPPSPRDRSDPLMLPADHIVGMAVTDSHFWLKTNLCPMCARVEISHEKVDFTRATDAQLARLQRWLGKPASPALRTAAAWRRAFSQ